MKAETVIAIHPPFAWLVNWEALIASGQRWSLVTNHESFQRLERDGRLSGFTRVVVATSFDAETLGALIAPWIEDPVATRLATMLEPMQLIVAALRERFGITGTTKKELLPFTHKLVMKATMQNVGELLPKYIAHEPEDFLRDPILYAKRAVKILGLPMFVKPVAENSSVGTAKIDSEEALIAFLRSSTHQLEIDEYVEGDGYHIDSVVLHGQIVWFGAGKYAAPQGQTIHGAPNAGHSISPCAPLFAELERLHKTLLGSFSHVPDGCTHMEVLRRPDGRWVFLEVAARTVGARGAEVHLLSRGVDVRLIHYQIQAGLPPTVTERPGPHAGYYCPMKTRPGEIARVFEPPFQSQYKGEWASSWIKRTDVAKTMSMPDCLGVFILWNDNEEILLRDIDSLHSFNAYEIKETQ